MSTLVTFWFGEDELSSEQHNAIYDAVGRLGGYDVEIVENHPDAPERPHRGGGRKKKR